MEGAPRSAVKVKGSAAPPLDKKTVAFNLLREPPRPLELGRADSSPSGASDDGGNDGLQDTESDDDPFAFE